MEAGRAPQVPAKHWWLPVHGVPAGRGLQAVAETLGWQLWHPLAGLTASETCRAPMMRQAVAPPLPPVPPVPALPPLPPFPAPPSGVAVITSPHPQAIRVR